MAKKSAHTKALEIIASHPDAFGIPGVVGYVIEQTLLGDGRRVIAQPDLVFFCKNEGVSEVYIVEYKGNGNGNYYLKAQDQVARAASWFGKYTPYQPENIHFRIISGNDPKYKELFKEFMRKKR